MAYPVVIDDGGSTRIKRIMPQPNKGVMDGLLDVDDQPPNGSVPPGAHYSQQKKINGSFAKVLVVYLDSVGNSASNGTVGQTVVSFEVSCGGDHVVKGEFVPSLPVHTSPDLDLTVFGTQGPPMVECKQNKGKRRYVISNSAVIDKVTVNYNNGTSATLFDKAAVESTGVVVVYTSVFVS